MPTQRALFEGAGRRPTARDLVVRPQAGRALNRHQQTFNRLVARVEKLRAQFDRERQRLDAALSFHAAEIRPRVDRISAARQDVVRAILPFLDRPGLTRREKRDLEGLLAEQLDEILRTGGSLGGELGALFERLHGASVTDVEREQMEDMRSELESMFAGMGLDLDLSGFQPGMSDEELAAAAAQMTDDVKRQAEAAQAHVDAGRTKKQRERARRSEAIRKASLGSIYRQLARLLHPDLEQDPDARARKAALMQEVTAAYSAQDLHALLRLQLTWIHREEANAARLTDETLRAYNDVLKEQVIELEFAIDELYIHPKYEPLMEDAGAFGVRILRDGAAQVRPLDDLLESLTAALGRLQAPGALEEVRGAIRERRRVLRQGA